MLLRVAFWLGMAMAAAGVLWTFTPPVGVDMSYWPLVQKPVYGRRGPRVLVDEAHGNTHTARGRYAPLTRLLGRDGYRVARNRQPLIPALLETHQVLLVANPRGQLTAAEVTAVRDWVYSGGGLLLAADRGNALAAAFGVAIGQAAEPVSEAELAEHPIREGRAEFDQPVGKLLLAGNPALRAPNELIAGKLAAFEAGRGRVVAISDADALAALIDGDGKRRGINAREADNDQLALNILHWLSRRI